VSCCTTLGDAALIRRGSAMRTSSRYHKAPKQPYALMRSSKVENQDPAKGPRMLTLWFSPLKRQILLDLRIDRACFECNNEFEGATELVIPCSANIAQLHIHMHLLILQRSQPIICSASLYHLHFNFTSLHVALSLVAHKITHEVTKASTPRN
jgi:hypothetical protein